MRPWQRARRVGGPALVWALVLSFGCALPASGFGMLNGLGQGAEHERITRLALQSSGVQPGTLDQIAGTAGKVGAIGAPDVRLALSPAAHCDGGDHLEVDGYPQDAVDARAALERCKAYIFSRLREAVADAGAIAAKNAEGRWVVGYSTYTTVVPCRFTGIRGRAKCNVLEALGEAFHASQDFYAHTNWVDTNAQAGPPGLGFTRIAPWIDPRQPGAAFPRGLISGCFEGLPEGANCEGRVRHAVLNKDTPTSARSAVGNNFDRAFQTAAADTRDKWRWFEAAVRERYGAERGEVILCGIRSDRPWTC